MNWKQARNIFLASIVLSMYGLAFALSETWATRQDGRIAG